MKKSKLITSPTKKILLLLSMHVELPLLKLTERQKRQP